MSLCKLSSIENEVITSLFDNILDFEDNYQVLFSQFLKDGFIVNDSFDELEFIRFQNKNQIFSDKKLHLTINPTLDCNLKCWYCSTEYANAIHSGRMADKLVEALKLHIENQITQNKIPSLHLDWFGGEPLMYFEEVIKPIARFAKELCEKHNVILTQHATTNAVLMTPTIMTEMDQLGFTSFQIPLDGNEDHHNSIKFTSKNIGTFNTVISNINELVKRIPKVNIILRINYDKKTLYNIDEIIPLLSKEAKKHILVDFQKVWQIISDQKDKEQLAKVKELFRQNGLNSGYWAYQPNKYYKCYSDKLFHYAVNYDGLVFKCTAQDYSEEKSIGKLNEDGTISFNIEKLSQLLSRGTFENERCLSCVRLPLCMGPCVIRNFEHRTQNKPLPCTTENSDYPFDSFVIEIASRRGLLSE